MGGGLLQLVSRGQIDEYLTGNPQISFYEYVFKRHTNFSMESRNLDFISNKYNKAIPIASRVRIARSNLPMLCFNFI